MRRLLVRRSLTAVGIYSSVALGFLGTVVATRELSPRRLRRLRDGPLRDELPAVVLRPDRRGGARQVRLSLLDARGLGPLPPALLECAPLQARGLGRSARSGSSCSRSWRRTGSRCRACSPPGFRSGSRSRGSRGRCSTCADATTSARSFSMWSMALRLAGIAVGAHFGLAEAIAGVLAAQVRATASVGVVGLARLSSLPECAVDGRSATSAGRSSRSSAQSSAATGVLSLRGGLAPLLLGAVTSTKQVGLFRVAQAPQSGFQALSAPARMVLLTEQTRDWERGRQSVVLRGVRRYTLIASLRRARRGAAALHLDPGSHPPRVRPEATSAPPSAARLLVLAAAVQLVVGWTKSFPVVDRPAGPADPRRTASRRLVVLPLVARVRAAAGALPEPRRPCSSGCARSPSSGRSSSCGSTPRTSAPPTPRHRHRRLRCREGARRLGHLAARRRRPREPRARCRGVSCASAGHSVEVRDHRERARPRSQAYDGALDLAHAAEGCHPRAHRARDRASRRASRRRLHDRDVRPQLARRRARADAVRAQADRRSGLRARAAARHRRRRRRRVPARRRPAGGATAAGRARRRAEARRARLHAECATSASSRSAGASTRAVCRCSRTRRRRCPCCRRAKSCGSASS